MDHHLRTRPDMVYDILSGEISSDLMSFFFVLSGFVAMYSSSSNDGVTTLDYITKRLRKTLLLYLIVTVIGCVDAQVRRWVVAENQLICGYLDFVLLSPWFPCRHPPYFNGSGWYLCTLYWLWLCFPFLRERLVCCKHAWRFATLAYLLNVCLFSVVWVPQWTWMVRGFPPLRLFEFCIGMLAATTVQHRQVPTYLALCSGCLIVGYWILACAYLVRKPILWQWEEVPENFQSVVDTTMVPYPNTDVIHETRLPLMQGKFALLWAVIIQWTACSELRAECDSWWVQWLDSTVFKLLSPFSLQLYLCHPWIPRGVHSLLRLIDLAGVLAIHMEFLFTYTICYMIWLWGQPVLDRLSRVAVVDVELVEKPLLSILHQ